jgi:large subunit ribosomal protein L22
MTMKRISPAPMGRAYRIRKRSNHVTILVESKPSAPAKKTAAPAKPAPKAEAKAPKAKKKTKEAAAAS